MYNAVCQFYPNVPERKTEKLVLPNKGGCKEGWWKFAGYCYKEFGLRVDPDSEGLLFLGISQTSKLYFL